MSNALLYWYDAHRRHLPWRAAPGEFADPYRVWLSEIMLQQTTVTAVEPYFRTFMERWPTVAALAQAPLDEVLTAWAGLGYYTRARNLAACAQRVIHEHGGAFPSSESELRKLPGVGPYTAAAIAAIAVNRPTAPVDGNIERVLSRAYGIDEPLPEAKERINAVAATLVPRDRPGDHAQALMDLGATICTPRRPRCLLCPWERACVAHAEGMEEKLPRKKEKAERPTRRGVAYFAEREDGAVFLRQRPHRGLLAGLWELPTTDWDSDWPNDTEARKAAPISMRWRTLDGVVRHTFTHFSLELQVWRGGAAWNAKPIHGTEGQWIFPDEFDGLAFSSLMKKVLAHARQAEAPSTKSSAA
ncbi:MAG: A/G-specific adenine glycosylase [Pseudorhodoplanes sp.]